MGPSLVTVDMQTLNIDIADGTCAIQPFLIPGKASAHVAPINTYVATATVIQRCVGGNPSTGGQVRDFGKLRDLQSA